ncbi:MAG: sodium/glutamate symporter [Planctomycetota bacterium]
MSYEIGGADIVILAIFVLGLGQLVNERLPVLKRINIPIPVTGGLIFSIGVAIAGAVFDLELTFDMRLRDLLLLVFFSTIGLGAKLRSLAAGGKALAILLALAAIFLILQDVTGVVLAMAFGGHPGYGLFAGSISFAGGHGTAIAWGEVAEEAGLENASELGVAFATFGLIAGGIIGGPVAGKLITKLKLDESSLPAEDLPTSTESQPSAQSGTLFQDIMGTVLMLAICVSVGDVVNRVLFAQGVVLPGFLTAMVVGIVITNVRDIIRKPVRKDVVDTASDLALNLFLAISLMSMDLSALTASAGPILVVLFVQMLVITLFAVLIVFRFMGRDYDAAVISGGFVGLGLGATPVAIANMHAITSKYRPSPKAMLVVPLVGAFFIDIVNSLVIKFFMAMPFMQQGAGG